MQAFRYNGVVMHLEPNQPWDDGGVTYLSSENGSSGCVNTGSPSVTVTRTARLDDLTITAAPPPDSVGGVYRVPGPAPVP